MKCYASKKTRNGISCCRPILYRLFYTMPPRLDTCDQWRLYWLVPSLTDAPHTQLALEDFVVVIVGMKMGNIAPRAGSEPTLLAILGLVR